MIYFFPLIISIIPWFIKKTNAFSRVNELGFKKIKETQDLNIDFKEYPAVCIRTVNMVEREPQK